MTDVTEQQFRACPDCNGFYNADREKCLCGHETTGDEELLDYDELP